MADVGTCYTVDAERHVGGFTMFAWCGKFRCPQHYRENVGAHNTVDASEEHGGALPYLSGMGVDDANNTVGKMSAYTTLLGFC